MKQIPGLFLSAALTLPAVAAAAPPQPSLIAFPGSSKLAFFADCVNALEAWAGPRIPDWMVHSTTYSYLARKPLYDSAGLPELDPDGTQACAQVLQSGRIFFPPAWRVQHPARLPLVVYPHFTSLRKLSVPSAFGGPEWVFGAAAALYYGFAVAMPDLPGSGADARGHNGFCHANSLAYSILDGVPAMRATFRDDPYPAAGGYQWDGRLFMVGYSAGGYAALAAVKEWTTHTTRYGFTLTGSACMAGPFDLSGLARQDLIKPGSATDFDFFLPFFLVSYHHFYGPRLDPRKAFVPELLEPREDGELLCWLEGALEGFTISDLIAKRLGKPRYRLPFRDLLDPGWVARELEDPAYATSQAHQVLAENDLHQGWAPTTPILFCHSPLDDDVGFQQSVETMASLSAEIHRAGGGPERLLVLKRIGDEHSGPTHIKAIPRALSMAFRWIYDGMPMGGDPATDDPITPGQGDLAASGSAP